MKSRGVSTGIHYPIALPNLTAYKHLDNADQDFTEATRTSQEILSLPMFPEMTDDQIEYVADAIREYFGA